MTFDTVEAFKEFYRDNPHVYAALVRLARQAKEAGYRKLGMKQLFEVLRWEFTVVTRSDSGFKLNNNFTAPYARIIMYQEPDLAGFFEIRGGDWVPQVGAAAERGLGRRRRKVTRRPFTAPPVTRTDRGEEFRETTAPRQVPPPRHMASSASELRRHERKPRGGRAQSKVTTARPSRPKLTPEQQEARREELRRRAEDDLRKRLEDDG